MPKISLYPAGGAILATDQFVVARAGANKSILGSSVSGGGGTGMNYIINGGFDIAQRQVPATLTTIADRGFGADRWQQFAENASWQYNRNDATGEAGLTSRYYGLFKKITNTGKGIFTQKVIGTNSVPLRGKTVIFQIKMKASANKTIRIGILELQNAGTIDTFPAAIASAFGANTVDPTWGANVAVITAAASCAVLAASWTSFSISVTVPSNSKNIVCAIWTDSQFAANDTLSVAEAGLFVASTVQAWTPRLLKDELGLCQYHCFVPATSGATSTQAIYFGARSGTAVIVFYLYFPEHMFAIPTQSNNISAWTAGGPGTTTIAAFNYVLAAFTTIVGALTVGCTQLSVAMGRVDLTAGTSFSGTTGQFVEMYLGPDVLIIFSAEI